MAVILDIKRESIRRHRELADYYLKEADKYLELLRRAELELSILEGEQAIASGAPMVTLDDALESKGL